VSGTIAAQDNGKGVVGVAPGASLFIARVFDSTGEFTASNLVVAMNACADANANIISMSLGGPIVSVLHKSKHHHA
jgi:subtilisin family serine protease